MPSFPGGVGITIGIPSDAKPVCVEWAFGLMNLHVPTNFETRWAFIKGAPVAEARQAIADAALRENSRYLFFLGTDVTVPSHCIRQLIFHLEHYPKYAVAGGIYVQKNAPQEPLVYRGNGRGPYWDWKVGEVFEVSGIGMDATLIRVDALRDLKPPYFKTVDSVEKSYEGKNAAEYWTEDLYFCHQLEQKGWKIMADGGILCTHWDNAKSIAYNLPPNSKPWRRLQPMGTKKIVDLGCGSKENSYQTNEGEVVRVDVREEVEPDYRCDLRKLPFADKSYDVVFCATPGQRVLTENGWRNIEIVKRGDYVVGRSGLVKVTDIFALPHSGSVFRLKTAQGTIEVTGEHPIATPAGWVKANKLRKAAEVFCSPTQIQQAQSGYNFEVARFVRALSSLGSYATCSIPTGDSPFAVLDDKFSLLSFANKIWKQSQQKLSSAFTTAMQDKARAILASAVSLQFGRWGTGNIQPLAYQLGSMNQHGTVAIGDAYTGMDAIADRQANCSFSVDKPGEPSPIRLFDVHDVSTRHYIGQVYNLETEDGTFFLEGVLTHNSSHTLEHFDRREVNLVLDEMRRILKDDGELRLVVPNLEWAAKILANGESNGEVMNVLYGEQDYPENYHKVGFIPKVLEQCLVSRGFTKFMWENVAYHMIVRAFINPPADIPVITPAVEALATMAGLDGKGVIRTGNTLADFTHGEEGTVEIINRPQSLQEEGSNGHQPEAEIVKEVSA